MKEYTAKDGQAMKFNVFAIPLNESIMDAFPSLKRIMDDLFMDLYFKGSDFDEKDIEEEVVEPEMTPDQILRYIILVYHMKSPLVQDEEDIMWRKKTAMKLCGIPTDDKGFFSPFINGVIANRNPNSVNLIMRFLKFESNLDWVELCSLTELLYDYQRIISEESVGTKGKSSADVIDRKLAARTKTHGLRTEIKALSVTLFQGDIDLMNYVGSTVVKEDIRQRLTPESRAKR